MTDPLKGPLTRTPTSEGPLPPPPWPNETREQYDYRIATFWEFPCPRCGKMITEKGLALHYLGGHRG